jgi:hypothetical protein
MIQIPNKLLHLHLNGALTPKNYLLLYSPSISLLSEQCLKLFLHEGLKSMNSVAKSGLILEPAFVKDIYKMYFSYLYFSVDIYRMSLIFMSLVKMIPRVNFYIVRSWIGLNMSNNKVSSIFRFRNVDI